MAVWFGITALKIGNLAFLRRATWLNSSTIQERPKVINYPLNHPVWFYLVIPSANLEFHHPPLGVTNYHQATTPIVFLLGSRLAVILVYVQLVRELSTDRIEILEAAVLEFSL
jgi:hypothetical protein